MPGFNPDPSIVHVDGVYYLVTSTFEYLPGMPVYRSTDLAQWTQIGNVATRAEQVCLDDVPTPGGVWAPTIRYRDGVFYVIVTVMLGSRGCVVFTASDPAGPWSDGRTIEAIDGIDPDLAWDDEGTAYVTFARFPNAIQQARVDLDSGAAMETPRPLWSGSGLYAPEGPHLYQRGDYWYLLGARSTGSPIQNLGHADLVDTPDGATAAVLLGVRPDGLAQAFSPLGRETFITDVVWTDDWPHPGLVSLNPEIDDEERVFDFSDAHALDDPGWMSVRRLPADAGSLTATPDRLTITGDGAGMYATRPHFIGRRQRHLTATASCVVDAAHGTAGLAMRYSEDNFLAIEAHGTDAATEITARAALASLNLTWHGRLPAGEVTLCMEMTPPPSDFSAGAIGGDQIRLTAQAIDRTILLAELDGRHWSFETAKSFTGRVLGLYATDGDVTFESFTYRGTNRPPR